MSNDSNTSGTNSSTDNGNMHADVVVLGAGPGGYSAAFRAADLGLNVILVERDSRLGGVCLNVGCIPSKTLLHAAAVISEARHMEKNGISFGKPQIDIDKLRDFKDSVIGKLTGGLTGLAKQRKVTVVHGEGSFTSPTSLAVMGDKGQKNINFDKCIIAAGSRVTIFPTFESDDERVIDSTGALELREIPKTMLIVGGGIIGLEMATVYAELGTEVTICELTDQIIPGADKDIIRPLEKHLRGICKDIHLGTLVSEIKSLKGGIKVSFGGDKAPEPATYDYVLVATGRRPNGDLLSADKAGVNVDERGFISVNDQMQTNVPHIFAIGDLAGQPMLAHKAVHEGHVAAEVCAGEKSAFLAKVIPSVAYTDPEVAWIGETEVSAKENGVKYEKASFPWAASGRALSIDRPEGMTKLLFDPETDRIIGAGIVGPGAGDLISEIALAIEMGADAEDIALTIHPHPTLSESVGMAAEMFEGTLTDLYAPKKKKK
jgi:dihydrolipoamide dehydrogenase